MSRSNFVAAFIGSLIGLLGCFLLFHSVLGAALNCLFWFGTVVGSCFLHEEHNDRNPNIP